MSGALTDRTVVITGATRGIGRAIAKRFHQEGAQVAVTGRRLEACQELAAELGVGASAHLLDVTDDSSVASAISSIVADHGDIDILVNSAGLIQYHTPVWQTSVEDWDRMIAVHDDPYRPQPRIDRNAGGGMTTSVGRLRFDDVGLRYMLVSHNTKMGAAKGAVLVAESMADDGLI